MVRLNSEDNARFLTLFEQSAMHTKVHFILDRIFNKELQVININKASVDYYTRLTS